MMLGGHKTWGGPLTAKIFHDLLRKRIETLDVESAKADIIRFASSPAGLLIWSGGFFLAAAQRMTFA